MKSVGTVDTGGAKVLLRHQCCLEGERSIIFSFGSHDISNAI